MCTDFFSAGFGCVNMLHIKLCRRLKKKYYSKHVCVETKSGLWIPIIVINIRYFVRTDKVNIRFVTLKVGRKHTKLYCRKGEINRKVAKEERKEWHICENRNISTVVMNIEMSI